MLNGKKEFWEIENDKHIVAENLWLLVGFVWELFVWFIGCLFFFSLFRNYSDRGR